VSANPPKRLLPRQPLLPSVLDRLLVDAASGTDPTRGRVPTLAELQSALRRDIEALLNTHQYSRPLPRELPELSHSLLEYGMPHFLGLAAASAAAREEFRVDVEDLLRSFEPRLAQVTVSLLENAENLDRTLRLRIDALMLVEPAPEPVCFSTVLETVANRFAVTMIPY
jgi:type VI secretion system protein ImpF